MKFSDLIKKVELITPSSKMVNVEDICAQYNPDRFKYWKRCQLSNDKDKNILDMNYSPHVTLLKNKINFSKIEKTLYYQLQKLYGRKYEWILDKINQFIMLHNSIVFHYDEKFPIQVLTQPIVSNKYTGDRFEIYEGHHRLACVLANGYKQILAQVYDWRLG